MDRNELIKVYQDTSRRIAFSELLRTHVARSIENTKFYLPAFHSLEELGPEQKFLGNVYVTEHKTIEAVLEWKKNHFDAKVAILNFASATNPGGGVENGASAQEESICRCSTLHKCLMASKVWKNYYAKNRANPNPLHTDDLVYTPDVLIIKDDNFKLIDPVFVDVITCAAPNLREQLNNRYNQEGTDEQAQITDEELYNLHVSRAIQIVKAAIDNGVNFLVLGAFGCGVFRNNPYIVAKAYRDVLKHCSTKFIDVEFAVYCGKDKTNYEVFSEVLG